MHKTGKWARQILALQDEEGKWGSFHSLSSGAIMTTEQALRRLECLGFTIEDPSICRAVEYMDDCLAGRKAIPDQREKTHDWDAFTEMILSTWIRRFTRENPRANEIAGHWAQVVSRAFAAGQYNHEDYVQAYTEIMGKPPAGSRLVDFTCFYPVSLMAGELDMPIQQAMVDYILNKPDGIYYIYDKPVARPPENFQSREASRWLGALELLAAYPGGLASLAFGATWLEEQRDAAGTWDMSGSAKDQVYFPLSDSWRRQRNRVQDCTQRIEVLLARLRARPGALEKE